MCVCVRAYVCACMHGCVCVGPFPRILITSGVMWHDMDPLQLVSLMSVVMANFPCNTNYTTCYCVIHLQRLWESMLLYSSDFGSELTNVCSYIICLYHFNFWVNYCIVL